MRRVQGLGEGRWRLVVGLLCIALAVFAGTLSAAHAHEQGGPVHADCGFCVTAHGSSQAAAPLALGPAAAVVGGSEAGFSQAAPRLQSRSAFYIRPPPMPPFPNA